MSYREIRKEVTKIREIATADQGLGSMPWGRYATNVVCNVSKQKRYRRLECKVTIYRDVDGVPGTLTFEYLGTEASIVKSVRRDIKHIQSNIDEWCEYMGSAQ